MHKINRSELVQFGSLELLAKQAVEGFITGLHKSPFHGFSVEFAEHRIYNQGESTKHIDWKLFGKTDRLYTKKYDEETNLRCQILFDTSSSMYFQQGENLSKIEYAILAGASIMEILKKQRDAVGITCFDKDINIHTTAKSSLAHIHFIYQELEKYLHNYKPVNAHSTNLIDSIHTIAELTHKRSLVILFSDLLDSPEKEQDFIEAVQHLKYNKHEVIIFHVTDQQMEIEFNLPNRPIRIIDMETNEEIKLQPSEFKANYQSKVNSYFENLKLKLGQQNIDFIPIDTNQNLEFLLQQFLIKRRKSK
jgi:uncharacterized protein (DUF58 family)